MGKKCAKAFVGEHWVLTKDGGCNLQHGVKIDERKPCQIV